MIPPGYVFLKYFLVHICWLLVSVKSPWKLLFSMHLWINQLDIFRYWINHSNIPLLYFIEWFILRFYFLFCGCYWCISPWNPSIKNIPVLIMLSTTVFTIILCANPENINNMATTDTNFFLEPWKLSVILITFLTFRYTIYYTG